jgi:hypothetical protein
VDLDEEMFGVAAPAVGPWQRQLNELGGVKPLAFGQYGELGPRFEQLLDQLAEERVRTTRCGRSGQAAPHPQPRSSEGSGSAAPAAEAAGGDDNPKGTTHYRGGTPRRRGATRKTSSSTAQPRHGKGVG